MKLIFIVILQLCFLQNYAQNFSSKFKEFKNNDQFKNAIVGVSIVDVENNKTVFGNNDNVGLVPASCMKVITAMKAYEILGNQYSFQTKIFTNGIIENSVLKGDIYIEEGSDCTLGSDRFFSTKPDKIFTEVLIQINQKGIEKINGNILIKSNKNAYKLIPDGWIWQDIGNYYGAPNWSLNWQENKVKLVLQTGIENTLVKLVKTEPSITDLNWIIDAIAGPKGSGDNAFVYMVPLEKNAYLAGTIGASENAFEIYSSHPNPPMQFAKDLKLFLERNKKINNCTIGNYTKLPTKLIATIKSPNLDTIISHFLDKSINLYGESLLDEINKKNKNNSRTQVLKEFENIPTAEINIKDGCGLAPANRITPNALAKALAIATKKKWYNNFYAAMPTVNGTKMKSGYINGVRTYAGYFINSQGKQYSFSIMVNNFEGKVSLVTNKLKNLVDEMKLEKFD